MGNNMVNMEPVILLIDGAHTLRRSMYQPALRELSTSTGVPTGGIFGFMQSLKSAVSLLSASATVVCWEGGHSERRKEVYDLYKHREQSDEEPEKDQNGYTDYDYYCHQLSWIKQLLTSLGVPQLQVKGKEGDDVIFQASRLIGGRKVIISEDSDFYSLIGDDIDVYRPIQKKYINLTNFSTETGNASPKHFLYSKVLLGDGSDNIPSVAKGVGGKTVQNILSKIENPEELSPNRILKEAASFKGARYQKLVDAGEFPIIRNLNLIDISKEHFDMFELLSLIDTLKESRNPDMGMVNKLFHYLEFQSNTMSGVVNSLLRMSSYPIGALVDKDYLKRVLAGQTSALQG